MQSALYSSTGNATSFLIPKKEEIFAIGFSQSERIGALKL
jgi:hypothetical protein